MPFKPGDPKPPGSGRKKGQKSRRKVAAEARLRDQLEARGVVVEDVIAACIKRGDVDMLRAMNSLLPYLTPRIATEAPPKPKSETKQPDEQPAEPVDLAKVLHVQKTPSKT